MKIFRDADQNSILQPYAERIKKKDLADLASHYYTICYMETDANRKLADSPQEASGNRNSVIGMRCIPMTEKKNNNLMSNHSLHFGRRFSRKARPPSCASSVI